ELRNRDRGAPATGSISHVRVPVVTLTSVSLVMRVIRPYQTRSGSGIAARTGPASETHVRIAAGIAREPAIRRGGRPEAARFCITASFAVTCRFSQVRAVRRAKDDERRLRSSTGWLRAGAGGPRRE